MVVQMQARQILNFFKLSNCCRNASVGPRLASFERRRKMSNLTVWSKPGPISRASLLSIPPTSPSHLRIWSSTSTVSRQYWWTSSNPSPPSNSSPVLGPNAGNATPNSAVENFVEESSSNSILTSTQDPSSTVEASSLSTPPFIEPAALSPDPISQSSAIILDHVVEPAASHAALALSVIPPSAIGSLISPIGIVQHLYVGFSYALPFAPFWSVIFFGTIIMRALLMPWAIDQMRSSNKMIAIRPQMEAVQGELKLAASKGDKQSQQLAALKLQTLFKDNGIKPGSMIGNIFVMFVPSIFSFFAVRRFCTADPSIPGTMLEAFGWTTDLTAADPTYVLPIISLLAFQGQFKVMQWEQVVSDKATWQAHTPNLMRMLMVMTAPLFLHLPGGVFVYFIATATWGIIQALLLRIPALRSRFRIPLQSSTTNPPSLLETIQKIRLFIVEKLNTASSGW